MAADNKEAVSNENSGADAVAFASALLGGGAITDEEESAPKENLLTYVTTPAESITAGVIAANGPKRK